MLDGSSVDSSRGRRAGGSDAGTTGLGDWDVGQPVWGVVTVGGACWRWCGQRGGCAMSGALRKPAMRRPGVAVCDYHWPNDDGWTERAAVAV